MHTLDFSHWPAINLFVVIRETNFGHVNGKVGLLDEHWVIHGIKTVEEHT